MRTKRRYLALQLDGDCVPGEREFLDAIWHSLLQIYGERGASVAGLVLISYDVEAKRAVLRVSLVALDMARVALVFLTRVGDCELAVHVVGVSGTVKALRSKFLV
jgi:RNase P/RNase MRP subunit POP5